METENNAKIWYRLHYTKKLEANTGKQKRNESMKSVQK